MREVPVQLQPSDIPADFEVRPLGPDENPPGRTTDGTCGLSWDDTISTGWTPAPSARCPFEYFHHYEEIRTPMNLYAETSQYAGRDAVYAATECLAAAIYALNSSEGDGTNPEHKPYRPFAYQTRATNQAPASPYQLAHEALDGIWRMLAEIDGFRGEDIDTIVNRSGDVLFDMIGESDPARRAYEYARDEVDNDAEEYAHEEALDRAENEENQS